MDARWLLRIRGTLAAKPWATAGLLGLASLVVLFAVGAITESRLGVGTRVCLLLFMVQLGVEARAANKSGGVRRHSLDRRILIAVVVLVFVAVWVLADMTRPNS